MSRNRGSLAVLAGCLALSTASMTFAEVSLTDRHLLVQRHRAKSAKAKGGQLGPVTNATGSQALIDASGMKWFIDTNITFSTTSSASGSASEASYTHAVSASTISGGLVTSTLNDAFDGYNSLCVSLTGATGPCATGNPAYSFYNQSGPATTECAGRQIVFPAKTIGPLSVSRKVFIPANDSFGRWMNLFTNTSGAPVTFTMVTGNNLGSDNNTRIVSSSSGDNVAALNDTWVSTFQNFSGVGPGSASSDPRIGHVLRGAGGAVGLTSINFADGDDNPFWSYTLTLPPGASGAIVNFAVLQPTKALANAKAAELAGLPANAQQCLSPVELGQIRNFSVSAALSITKSDGVTSYLPGQALTYTIVASNAGPAAVTGATVADTFPPELTNVSWTCVASGGSSCPASGSGNLNAGVTLLSGGTATFTVGTLVSLAATGSIANTAAITAPVGVTDPTPANNTATDTDTPAGTDLSITNSDGISVYIPGQTLVYSIVASNAGPLFVTGAAVADAFPADLANVSWTCAASAGSSCGAASGTGNINTTADLLVGGNATFTVAATASVAATGDITNTATIAPPVSLADTSPANNTASDTDTRRGGAYYTITPCRLADTRGLSAPALSAGVTRTFAVVGHCGVPASATAIGLNLTVTDPTDDGHLTLLPTGRPAAAASAINYSTGQTRANNGVYALGAGGQIDLEAGQATGTVQVIIDIAGYFVE
jgi:uncharacterized repeat protein (TIGR01451 family)